MSRSWSLNAAIRWIRSSSCVFPGVDCSFWNSGVFCSVSTVMLLNATWPCLPEVPGQRRVSVPAAKALRSFLESSFEFPSRNATDADTFGRQAMAVSSTNRFGRSRSESLTSPMIKSSVEVVVVVAVVDSGRWTSPIPGTPVADFGGCSGSVWETTVRGSSMTDVAIGGGGGGDLVEESASMMVAARARGGDGGSREALFWSRSVSSCPGLFPKVRQSIARNTIAAIAPMSTFGSDLRAARPSLLVGVVGVVLSAHEGAKVDHPPLCDMLSRGSSDQASTVHWLGHKYQPALHSLLYSDTSGGVGWSVGSWAGIKRGSVGGRGEGGV
eukprot:m.80101 g.80101  ORF g.80101 m.80101 type:complete len:327 (-) comp19347_c0_seq1:190-1170(-)